MKDKIIDKIRKKRNKDGAEVFFLLCADASNLNAAFRRTFNATLRQFEAIEKLEKDIKERQQKTKDAYAELTLNPTFAEAVALLVAEKNRKAHAPQNPQGKPRVPQEPQGKPRVPQEPQGKPRVPQEPQGRPRAPQELEVPLEPRV